MKKALLILGGVLVGVAVLLGVIQLFFSGESGGIAETQEETPIVLAQVDISGGLRLADSEYIVARRFYSNGVVLEKTNTEEIAIYKELTSEGVATYQALLEAYNGPESLGPKKTEEQSASWAD